MGVIAVNWSAAGLTNEATLKSSLDALPRGGRVTIMVHGFRFDPNIAGRNPHSHIFSLRPRPSCWKAISWPRHLHMDRDEAHLGIGFGWPAADRLTDVAQRAFSAGAGLASLIARIVGVRPDLRVGLVAHSLGARVALAALAMRPRPACNVACFCRALSTGTLHRRP